MIIDAHAHLGPAVGASVRATCYPSGAPEDLLAVMDRCGIQRAVVFAAHWQSSGELVDPNHAVGNQYVHDAVRKHPDRLIGFARVNPNLGKAALEMLDRCLDDYGMRGIKLHPDWDSFYMANTQAVDPIFSIAARRKVPVLIHAGYPLRAQPLLFLRYAERFPSVSIILAHMAHRLVADAIAVAERASNIYLESSCQASVFILRAARRVGVRRVLFGSDFPYELPDVEMAKITEFPGFTAEERQQILGGKAGQANGILDRDR
jgi:uncharacterized protein